MLAEMQFKGFVKFNSYNFSQSSIQFQVKHAKGWRTLFEFTAQDMVNLFTKKQLKRNKK